MKTMTFLCHFSSRVKFERDKKTFLDQYDSDGALSAPELPMSKRKDRGM